MRRCRWRAWACKTSAPTRLCSAGASHVITGMQTASQSEEPAHDRAWLFCRCLYFLVVVQPLIGISPVVYT